MQRGFTLVELLVVVAIMAMLATVAMPLAELSRRRSQEEELRRALREIRTAIDAHKRMVDSGLIARSADGTGYPPNLLALVDGVPNAQVPGAAPIYLLRRLPRDPMASAVTKEPEATWGLRSYASPPDAPAEGKDVFDVYSLSAGVGLDGRPYREW